VTENSKNKCVMSVYIFEWTRTVISQQYLDSMSLDSPADRNNVIKELALTAKVKVEWNNNGQVFLEGAWEHIMNIHVSLYTCCPYVHWGRRNAVNINQPKIRWETYVKVAPM
jgi:hypothetical protein